MPKLRKKSAEQRRQIVKRRSFEYRKQNYETIKITSKLRMAVLRENEEFREKERKKDRLAHAARRKYLAAKRLQSAKLPTQIEIYNPNPSQQNQQFVFVNTNNDDEEYVMPLEIKLEEEKDIFIPTEPQFVKTENEDIKGFAVIKTMLDDDRGMVDYEKDLDEPPDIKNIIKNENKATDDEEDQDTKRANLLLQ